MSELHLLYSCVVSDVLFTTSFLLFTSFCTQNKNVLKDLEMHVCFRSTEMKELTCFRLVHLN